MSREGEIALNAAAILRHAWADTNQDIARNLVLFSQLGKRLPEGCQARTGNKPAGAK
jgi:hypothetical protein